MSRCYFIMSCGFFIMSCGYFVMWFRLYVLLTYEALVTRLYSLLETSQTGFKRGPSSCSSVLSKIKKWREQACNHSSCRSRQWGICQKTSGAGSEEFVNFSRSIFGRRYDRKCVYCSQAITHTSYCWWVEKIRLESNSKLILLLNNNIE